MGPSFPTQCGFLEIDLGPPCASTMLPCCWLVYPGTTYHALLNCLFTLDGHFGLVLVFTLQVKLLWTL